MSHPAADSSHAVRVIVALADGPDAAGSQRECLDSLRRHLADGTPLVSVPARSDAVNEALFGDPGADCVLILAPCRVTGGFLARLRDAALADDSTATASTLSDRGTALALDQPAGSAVLLAELAERVERGSERERPRLQRAVGPCVYVRRDALELVGQLDEQLTPRRSVEVDFAGRCLLAGLSHVAADDVVVEPLGDLDETSRAGHLDDGLAAEPAMLARALEAARRPRERLPVTIDARALEGVITGTHVHTLELIRALAGTGALALRVLVCERRVDGATLELLRRLPGSEVLFEEHLDDRFPPSTVAHRPQQAFAVEDVDLALRLGERVVLSQLDMIAYSNPGYFPDAEAWAAFRRASRHGMASAERVVVFSRHTARELTSAGLVDDERIRVIPPGLDHGEPEAQAPSGLAADGGGPFLLCLGTDFRHKNRLFALRLLAELRDRHGFAGRLVLAGTHIPNGSSLELERALLDARPELREAVTDLGAVSEPERVWLMRGAVAVVYPSVYEGFGLVPLEAGLHGVPCVFAARSALAETMPPGTATIVPWDAARSADAVAELLADTAARARHVELLAAAGRELTWAATASAIVEVYREAAVAPVRDAATLSRDLVARERELTAAHEVVVERLVGEREHARRMYDELNAEVGWGLSLIGPHGSLPEPVQRALLAFTGRPALSRPVFALLGRVFLAARALARVARR
jgi:glycosyltransferase involved in cell wall biosynthesis